MKYLLSIMAVLLLTLQPGSGSVAEEQQEGAVLESISYEKDEHNRETIIFKLNGTHIPKIFKIKGERPRLVFDFLDTRYSDLINRIIDTKGDLIKGVRVGIHNDPAKTRVVVDLEPDGGYQIEQDFLVQENILSITFYPNEEGAENTKAEETTPAVAPDAAPPVEAPAVQAQVQTEVQEQVQAEGQVTPDTEAAAGDVASPAEPVEVPAPVPADVAVPAEPLPTGAAADVAAAETDLREAVPDGGLSAAEAPLNPLLAPPAEPKAAPADPLLRDVSFEGTTDNGEMVLFKLNDFYPPIVFGIEKGTPRVVCDFLDTELAAAVRPVIDTGGNYVNRIRVARHQNPDKVRVVLDLVPNRNYDLQQVFFKEDNLFVIIINEFEEEPLPPLETSSGAEPSR